MAWTDAALSRCACGHEPSAHVQRAHDGGAVLLGCGLCGCGAYDPRADVAAERGAALAWDLSRRLREASESRDRLLAVVLAARDGRGGDARAALAALRPEDLTTGVAGEV